MADDKDDIEAIDLARRFDLTTEEAREIIRKAGDDPAAVSAAAQAFKENPTNVG